MSNKDLGIKMINTKNYKWVGILFLVTLLLIQRADAKWFKQKKKQQAVQTKTVTYTVPTAKAEAFKGLETYLPLTYYKSDLKDPYITSNLNYIKHGTIIKKGEPQRAIYPSYCGNTLISYAIRYYDKTEKVYYYSSTGKLMRIEFDNNNPETYPKRSYTYSNKGNLNSVVFYVSKTDQYNFDGKGNLVVHWIGEKAYGRDGKLMRIRRDL